LHGRSIHRPGVRRYDSPCHSLSGQEPLITRQANIHAATPPLLAIARLVLRWPDGAALFDGLTLAVAPGVTLLQGDSGSGKTTLLRAIAGDVAVGGRIALRGRTRADDPAAWARDVVMVDADDERLGTLSPDGVVADLRARHGEIDEAAWQSHLDGFGLRPHLAKAMFQLSAGSRRKVVLAALLAARCPVTLLDEPGAGLDGASLRHLRQALAEARDAPSRAVLVVAGIGLDDLECNATVTLASGESA
jgi:ABC-type multidrug transport system ATPase subunit